MTPGFSARFMRLGMTAAACLLSACASCPDSLQVAWYAAADTGAKTASPDSVGTYLSLVNASPRPIVVASIGLNGRWNRDGVSLAPWELRQLPLVDFKDKDHAPFPHCAIPTEVRMSCDDGRCERRFSFSPVSEDAVTLDLMRRSCLAAHVSEGTQ